jgi:hypothetical protein
LASISRGLRDGSADSDNDGGVLVHVHPSAGSKEKKKVVAKKTTTQKEVKAKVEKPARVASVQYENFLFTVNNYTKECVENVKAFIIEYCSYGVSGPEKGEKEEVDHLQGYCELKKKLTGSSIRKLVGSEHFFIVGKRHSEIPKETAGYCKKGSTLKKDKPEIGWILFFENPHADFVSNGFEHGKADIGTPGCRNDLKDAAEAIRTGEKTVRQIRQEAPHTFHTFGRTLVELENDRLSTIFRQWETRGIWLCGKEGVGKGNISFLREYLGMVDGKAKYKQHWNTDKCYLWKYDGSGDQAWQDKYEGQPYVVINEFRGQLRFNDLLRLVSADILDVRRRNVGPTPWLPYLVVVNSIKMPREIYKKKEEMDDEPWGQFDRRFKVVRVRDTDHARELALHNINNKLVEYVDKQVIEDNVVVNAPCCEWHSTTLCKCKP